MIRPADEVGSDASPRARLVVNWIDDVKRLLAAPK